MRQIPLSDNLFSAALVLDGGSPKDLREIVRFGQIHLPFASMLLATVPQGLCWAGFSVSGSWEEPERRLRCYFPRARMIRDDTAVSPVGRWIESVWSQGDPSLALSGGSPLCLYGTMFQIAVWRALLDISMGTTCRYGDIAARIGNPRAAQAVGQAVGANPISLVVPCHRVIQANGDVRNYGWGDDLKRRLLTLEADLTSPSGRPTDCACG